MIQFKKDNKVLTNLENYKIYMFYSCLKKGEREIHLNKIYINIQVVHVLIQEIITEKNK